MLLVKVSKSPASPLTFCSVQSCVDKAISNYPLTPEEAARIHWKKTEDFYFLGNEDLFIHVLFNLIKNSLRATAPLEDAKISIWINKTTGENALHVKDNGPGIAKQVMPNIFAHFITDTDNGTGMGLAFCKMVMKSFKGEIICKSNINDGTEFILSFPNET
jgi:two-component system CAI-1 autoinducer sensor kinase/phosphatase CqsS